MKMSCMKAGDESAAALFRPFALKMEEQGMPSIVVNVFKCYFNQLAYGAQGKVSEKEIEALSPDDVKAYQDLKEYESAGTQALEKAVVIKLNGGLGTGMGLERAKSLIEVRDGLNFLDLIVRQVESLREKHGVELPLMFMNSFKTHLDTMMRIEGFDNGDTGVPLSFVQHRYPKILARDFAPASWPDNPELEWNPPGHGDVYTALVTSGALTRLRNRGYRWAFISNSDNLGAIMDKCILGLMSKEKLPFVMEVAQRTQADRKGGHLARLKKDGRLVLREVAQCPERDLDAFQDIELHRYFNTNSIWLDLKAFESVFVKHHMMPLDLIVNPKTLDPRNADSPKVLQIETAMGSAISNFRDAAAVLVPRSRFAPVKTTNDLLLVMSDCYDRTEDETLVPSPACEGSLPSVDLDPKFYKKIDDFLSRIPEAPSLTQCTSLTVKGDVRFGKGVVCKKDVLLENTSFGQAEIAEGEELEGTVGLD